MLAVTGYRSKIVEELRPLLPEGERIKAINHWLPPADMENEPEDSRRFFLCNGVLHAKRLTEQTYDEIDDSLRGNFVNPIALCERVLTSFPTARICVMGSESGYSWSFDDTYAASKAALHRYVETRKIGPKQQLVCVAPSIIGDCRMTTDRKDTENLERRRQESPKRRFLKACEVARLVHFLLYVDEGYISGTVIRMNGGQ